MPHYDEIVGLSRASQNPPTNPVTVGASPFIFTPGVAGLVLISGGTITSISYMRNGLAYTVGVGAGAIPVTPNDSIRVIYTVAPSMAFIPQ